MSFQVSFYLRIAEHNLSRLLYVILSKMKLACPAEYLLMPIMPRCRNNQNRTFMCVTLYFCTSHVAQTYSCYYNYSIFSDKSKVDNCYKHQSPPCLQVNPIKRIAVADFTPQVSFIFPQNLFALFQIQDPIYDHLGELVSLLRKQLSDEINRDLMMGKCPPALSLVLKRFPVQMFFRSIPLPLS